MKESFVCVDYIPVHETVALPVKPDLHLQTKWPGRLQHSAFSAQSAANDGISHSFMSLKIKIIIIIWSIKF